MSTSSDPVRRAIAAGTREEVLAALLPGRPVLGLPDIQRLSQHLESIGGPVTPLRVGILHTFTSELLNPYLRFEGLLQGLQPVIYHGPYGSIVQEASSSSDLVSHAPDLTLLLLRWEDLDPRLSGPLAALGAKELESLSDTVNERLQQQIGVLRRALGGHILIALLPPFFGPGLGEFDAMAVSSEQGWRWAVKQQVASGIRSQLHSTSLLDLDESVSSLGRDRFFDLRLWYSSRFPFSPAASQDIARRIMAIGVVLKRPRAKVIVLDADNTLWGGIIGEDGMTGIALGPDYPGNAYVAFQRRLLDYQQRGFVLALCSKNNEADLMEVLRSHPHQVLREERFAAMQVNWEPKPRNLQMLAEQLNLGLDSFVFIDDSDHECAVVRQTLPMVEVVQVPMRPIDIPTCLDRLARLQIVALTEEDRSKTEMYVQERRRRDLAAASGDIGSYLGSLQMAMTIGLNDARQVPRIAQLTQKTNQFNLTTRRYTEDDVARMMKSEDWLVAHFSLRDIFGDSGIVGVALIRSLDAAEAEIDSFLLSCRVIGRKAESAFLDTLLRTMCERGIRKVRAKYLPTQKNGLVKNFLPEHGFAACSDGNYVRDIEARPPSPEDAYPIQIEMA